MKLLKKLVVHMDNGCQDHQKEEEPVNDAEIIELYFARDEQAIVSTQEKYGKYCYSIALNILFDREDSEECVNDTWMRTWNAIPPQRPNKLQIFLGTITRNLAFDRYKSKRAQKRGGGTMEVALDELSECIPSTDTIENLVVADELEQILHRFLRSLPEKECNVFLRRYWYVEEYQEIANRYRIKLNTVKTILFRVRGKLKAYLEQEGIVI